MTRREPSLDYAACVTLFGVGGAGGNAVCRLFRQPETGMKIICANTDVQALRAAPSASQLQLGRMLTMGLGTGAKPEIGRAAAQEALPEINAALDGSGLCFIAAGLGGGTGTGAAPVIARAARERGIPTIGIATRPFAFEGARRARTAAAGLIEFQASVDALVVVCNEHLFRVAGPEATLRQALYLSDSIVRDSACDFAALIAGPALKRVTIADIRAVLGTGNDPGGRMVIGHGERCVGSGRAALAAESALRNPLLEDAPEGARRLLVTIAGGSDLGLFEVEEAVEYIREHVHAGAELVWGSAIDPALEGRVRVGITAAGLPAREAGAASAMRVRSMAALGGSTQPIPAAVTIAAPVTAVMQEACKGEPVVAPAHAITIDCGPAGLVEAIAPAQLIAMLPDQPRGPLILTCNYSLDLDIVANHPVSTRPVRSRSPSASLADRIYFAVRALKGHSGPRPAARARRGLREMEVIWGRRHSLV
ncbi:MAG: cell division protein FtsZ [Sphingomonas bacterium]